MRRFAAVAEAIRATTSTAAKVQGAADYLASLDDDRLAVAVRFLAGDPLPRARVLAVGGAALGAALRRLSQLDEGTLGALWAHYADAGDTTEAALLAAGHRGTHLDLLRVAAAFEDIAAAATSRARIGLLTELLRQCTPLEAKYVAKIVSGDLRIGLRRGLVEEAVAQASGLDVEAVRRADQVVADLGEVAVLARHRELHRARPRLFVPLRPMLASAAKDVAEVVARLGDEVWVEDKYDGVRCQLHRDGHRVVLFSRDLRDVTAQFPEIAEAARGLSGCLLLDGEILAWRGGRVLPFAALQTRLGRKTPSRALLDEVPVVFVAWDLMLRDHECLLEAPLRERRARLEELRLAGRLGVAHLERARGAAEVEALFWAARRRHNEGLIAKDPEAPYTPGRRGSVWLKLKRPLDTLEVVVVGAEWGHGKRRAVLSDVTFAVRDDAGDRLAVIGKAYTGLTDAEIAEMTHVLQRLTVAERGRYRVVHPEIVLEVAFDRVQPSSRHASGFALRFPRIVAWRRDKSPGEIDTLARVRELADGVARGAEQRVDLAPLPAALSEGVEPRRDRDQGSPR